MRIIVKLSEDEGAKDFYDPMKVALALRDTFPIKLLSDAINVLEAYFSTTDEMPVWVKPSVSREEEQSGKEVHHRT